MFQPTRMARARRGLTLIELVVVLMILAAVAAMVIARVGFVQEQAGNATSANAGADVMHNLEIYKTTTGNYPDRMDSLLDSDGTSPTGIMANHWNHPGGTVPFEMLELSSLSGTGGTGWTSSLAHSGVSNVVDYDPASDAWVQRPFFGPGGNTNLCFVQTSTALASAASIEAAAGFPNGLPTDGTNPTVRLVAFGIGPNSSIIGTTMGSAPSHAEASPDDYNRFIAIFAVYGNGKSMELRTVLDSRRSSVESNIQGYKDAAPQEN